MVDTPQSEEINAYSSSICRLNRTNTSENDGILSNRFSSHDSTSDDLEFEIVEENKEKKHVTDDNNDDKMCRICFSGPEDEDTSGRLISPCRCKGSMKYVHVECLNNWRLRSLKKTSFFQCDECKYKYAFRRTTIAKYITNEVILTLVTISFFAFCVLLGGFIVKLIFYFHPTIHESLLFDVDDTEGTERVAIVDKNLFTVSNIFTIDYVHVLFGIIFVGFIGFVQLLISIMWIGGPFQPFHTYRFGTGGGGRGNGRIDAFTAIFFSIIVILGVLKAFWGIYKMVKSASRKILERVELTILEVNETA